MENGDRLRSFYDPFIHILSLLLTSDVCWTLWLSNERNSCRAVVGCLSKVFSLRKDRCSNIFATSLQKAFNEESCSTDGPRATKVRGDLGFVYLLLVLTLTKVAVQTGEDDVHGKKGCERSLICVGCVGWAVDLLDFVGGLKWFTNQDRYHQRHGVLGSTRRVLPCI